mmetsp:Transcript_129/g.179  ORF Transcript_129/g.179 Transcript_129/m.179 type:complete len:488 (+) Transcript_129:308-1771(+)
MATDTLHTNSSAWPQVGNPPPNAMSPTDPNPEWEMVADDTTTNTATGDGKTTTDNNSNNNNDHVVILPADIGSSIKSNKNKIKGRPRSATIGGGQASSTPIHNNKTSSTTQHADRTTNPSDSNHGDTSISSDLSSRTKRRVLRRCVSTPDLLVSDNAHEVIVEDESDDDDETSSEEPQDIELDESFEVVSDNEDEEEEEGIEQDEDDSGEGTDEPLFMIDDEDTDIRCDEESATLVSTPSMDTSTAWTMASAVPSTATGTGSVWGMKKSPSFAEMLAKNIDSDGNSKNGGASVGWGADKTKTEAMLRNSHRKHHLRVKTKPKFIVTEDVGGKTMKHAHSTGDLSQMLVGAEQERARMFGQGRKRMTKKQFSDIMEEDEEGDFVIGRGDGGGGGGGGGGGDGDVLGDTDAMDFYHRKDKGSKGTSNKKKLRPDEAKRKDIIMHKKDLQRKKQAESQKGGRGSNEKDTPGKKKKKNEKGVGGKKERRRL